MPWNGTGTFAPLGSPEYPAVSGEVIYADYFNAIIDDLIDGLNNCVTRDYQEGDFWLNYTDPDKGAALVGFGDGVGYPANTVGEALEDLYGEVRDLIGTANQITVTATDPTTLTLGLPAALTAPGTLTSVGFADATNASAGNVGEYSSVEETTGVSVTTATTLDITSLALSAGDWEIGGMAYFQGSSTFAYSFLAAGLAYTTATLADEQYRSVQWGTGTAIGATAASARIGGPVPTRRRNHDAGFTVYLTARASFTAGTLTARGTIWARRIR